MKKSYQNEGFEYKGTHYRPMTVATLAILEAVDSPFFTDGAGVRALMDYLLVHSIPIKDARKLARDIDAWEDAAYELAEGFTPTDLQKLAELIEAQNEMVAKAVVEPEKKK